MICLSIKLTSILINGRKKTIISQCSPARFYCLTIPRSATVLFRFSCGRSRLCGHWYFRRFTQMNRPRSTTVTEGKQRAPQRAFFRAMGLTDEDIRKPWVGVASTWNEATPCNLTLDRQARAAKEGVKAAGGTPREF